MAVSTARRRLTPQDFYDLAELANTTELEAGLARQAAVEAQTAAGKAYVLASTGIPEEHLSSGVRQKLSAVSTANLQAVEWNGDLATTRPSTSTAIRYVWIKRDPALADPPTDATHMLAGIDVFWRAY